MILKDLIPQGFSGVVKPLIEPYPQSGVHIKGVGSSYSAFSEPKIQLHSGSWVIPPFGGEYNDLEAIFFDQDANYIYIAVVTSENPDSGGDSAPGDLALNMDRSSATGEYGYEYGVKIGTATGLSQWDICYMPDWQVGIYADVKPSIST